VDLVEISGGTYEQPKLLGLQGVEEEEPQNVAASTKLREAYFVDFARAMQDKVSIPLMVTGGFRRREAMEQAIESGSADLIGIGRPLCVDTDGPSQLLAGLDELRRHENDLALLPNCMSFLGRIPLVRAMAGFSTIYWFYCQLYSLAETGRPQLDLSPFKATLEVMRRENKLTRP